MENTPPPPPVAPPYHEPTEDKTVAIISYLTIIGFIIALIMHGNKKTRLGAFHLRQSLGLIVTGIALGVAVSVIGWVPLIGWIFALLSPLIFLGLFVLCIIGLIAAVNGQMKPLPLLGEHFSKWFANAFE